MKSWFVFLIEDKKIGTWANNLEEAKRNMVAEYGNISMKFLGINYGRIGTQPEEVIPRGMSSVDIMIASGTLDYLVSLRYM